MGERPDLTSLTEPRNSIVVMSRQITTVSSFSTVALGKPVPILLHAGSEYHADSESWWNIISPPMLSLMQSAGYSRETQAKQAQFVKKQLVRSLGPSPESCSVPRFDSFCNDDFSPVELSWNFHAGQSTVRIGLEPIGRSAGTSVDPFNALEMAKLMSRLLASGKLVNGTLWRHFSEDLAVDPDEASFVVAGMKPNEHMTVNTISFDLNGEPTPKVYFYPIAKALSLGAHAGELVCDSIERLEINVTPALDVIRAYVHDSKTEHGNILRMECLSFDAVDPYQSRLKVYLRTPQTSLRRVQEIYTLGGRLRGLEINACIGNLEAFWSDVLGVNDHDEELALSTHRTAGIIFNFELRNNEPLPKPKVYIPTRHYGGTDLAIAQGLSRFFHGLGWHQLADSYVNDVQRAL
jgi:DMATS type aromatic prenyltransferase